MFGNHFLVAALYTRMRIQLKARARFGRGRCRVLALIFLAGGWTCALAFFGATPPSSPTCVPVLARRVLAGRSRGAATCRSGLEDRGGWQANQQRRKEAKAAETATLSGK